MQCCYSHVNLTDVSICMLDTTLQQKQIIIVGVIREDQVDDQTSDQHVGQERFLCNSHTATCFSHI